MTQELVVAAKEDAGEPLKGEVIPPRRKVWQATFENAAGMSLTTPFANFNRKQRKEIVQELAGGKRVYFTMQDGERQAVDMHIVCLELDYE